MGSRHRGRNELGWNPSLWVVEHVGWLSAVFCAKAVGKNQAGTCYGSLQAALLLSRAPLVWLEAERRLSGSGIDRLFLGWKPTLGSNSATRVLIRACNLAVPSRCWVF